MVARRAATSAKVVGQPPLSPTPAVLDVPGGPAPPGQVGAGGVRRGRGRSSALPEAAVDHHHGAARAPRPAGRYEVADLLACRARSGAGPAGSSGAPSRARPVSRRGGRPASHGAAHRPRAGPARLAGRRPSHPLAEPTRSRRGAPRRRPGSRRPPARRRRGPPRRAGRGRSGPAPKLACRSAPESNSSRLSLQCTRSIRPVIAATSSTTVSSGVAAGVGVAGVEAEPDLLEPLGGRDRVPHPGDPVEVAGHRVVAAGGVLDQQRQLEVGRLDRLAPVVEPLRGVVGLVRRGRRARSGPWRRSRRPRRRAAGAACGSGSGSGCSWWRR